MRRSELEHAIRAATEIIRQDAVFIIGSQAILGSFTEDELPAEATVSEEVAIGELSHFHETHGFYVQGVGHETAVLPAGWTDRLVKVRTPTPTTVRGCAWSPTTFVQPNSSPAG